MSLAGARAGRWVFRDLNAAVPAGSALHLSGPNGSGKTTLLRILAGLMGAERGAVWWAGQPVTAPAPGEVVAAFRRRLSWVGQAAGLKPDLNPEENLMSIESLRGEVVSPDQVTLALAEMGLGPSERRPVRCLSQGQARRAALAALWLRRPGVGLWLLDEPFNALDTKAAAALQRLCQRHLQAGGVLVFSSHQSVSMEGPVQSLALGA
jgi:heme exporter protein A